MSAIRISLCALPLTAVIWAGCGSVGGTEPVAGTGSVTEPIPAACLERGSPVSLDLLIRTFRENGVSLWAAPFKCANPRSTYADASSFGPTGLERDRTVSERQGDVLCRVAAYGSDASVGQVHHPEDKETYVSVLNVSCSVYPSEPSKADEQIARVRTAIEALVEKVESQR
jgi:hypothetical protein